MKAQRASVSKPPRLGASERIIPFTPQKRQRESDLSLLARVRRFAQRRQKASPQVFLSLREAAVHFGAPLSQLASVYQQLRKDGILSSIRGAHTLIAGRGKARQISIRGLIGMPLSIARLHSSLGYRRCFFHIRDELKARGFGVSLIYFEEREIDVDEVVARANREKLDMIVWLRPHGTRHDTAERLRDRGIRFIGVNIGGIAVGTCRYEVRRRKAITTILHSWAKNGVAALIVVRAGKLGSGEKERLRNLGSLAEHEALTIKVVNVQDGRILRALKSHGGKTTGILLAESAAAILGSRATDRVSEVFESCRIALIDGPMDFPFADEIPHGVADVVLVDWAPIGRRIARDLLRGEAFDDSEKIIFQAQARLKVALSESANSGIKHVKHAA